MTCHPYLNPAVFLDRDGTLIEDVGFLGSAAGIRLFPDTVEALLKLQRRHRLFVITNQSGIAEGHLTLNQALAVNDALARMLADQGVDIAAWYVCPHNASDNCECRKPRTKFLLQAVKEHGVDLKNSYVVGDHPHDALTGVELGVSGIYLLTGHGRKHRHELPEGKPVFKCLTEAADWIVARTEHSEVS